jgi:hypothetical protein
MGFATHGRVDGSFTEPSGIINSSMTSRIHLPNVRMLRASYQQAGFTLSTGTVFLFTAYSLGH